MIKVFGFIARRKDLTPSQFHDHYRHPHGTLARDMPTLLNYTQSHQIETPLLDDSQRRFEAIMEVRLAGTNDWFGFRTNPYLVEYIVPDEVNFLDIERCGAVATSEEVLPPPTAGTLTRADTLWAPERAVLPIKLVQIVPVERQDSWTSGNDAELGHRIGALRHVRARAVPDIQAAGTEFGGLRELWWPTVAAFRTGVERDGQAWQQLVQQTGAAVTLLVQCERFF